MAREYKHRWKYRRCIRCRHESTSFICHNCCVELELWNIDRTKYPDKVPARKKLTEQDLTNHKALIR